MSRKDYVAIAAAIADTRALVTSGVATSALETVTRKVADVLEEDNPRFDRQRFIAATIPPAYPTVNRDPRAYAAQ